MFIIRRPVNRDATYQHVAVAPTVASMAKKVGVETWAGAAEENTAA
jgi:hypothetical protein